MYIARILYPVTVLGPGKRITIWMAGCTRHCSGCSNPELWEQDQKYRLSMENLKTILEPIIHTNVVDGFTITGGDPFYQPEALRQMLPYLHTMSRDILVYTGYQYEEISEQYKDIIKYVSVLIDGEYIESKNYGLQLRGSENQRIIFVDETVKERYGEYLKYERSRIQNFTTRDGIISVGIHLPDYQDSLSREVLRTELREAHE